MWLLIATVWASPSTDATSHVIGAVEQHHPELQACFRDDPTEMRIEVSLSERGTVDTLSATNGSGSLQNCVLGALSSLEVLAASGHGWRWTMTGTVPAANVIDLGRVASATSGGEPVHVPAPEVSSRRAHIGEPIILGALDRAGIDVVMQRALPGVGACFERTGAAGRVVTNVVIDPDGSVSVAYTRHSSGDEAVDSCVEAEMMRLQFERPKGGRVVVASYPFLVR